MKKSQKAYFLRPKIAMLPMNKKVFNIVLNINAYEIYMRIGENKTVSVGIQFYCLFL